MARPAPLLIDVAPTPAATEAAVVRSAPRLQSLDVFRGLTIAAMLLVNNPGSWSHVYPILEHVPWDGWTLADLVFPFFLFIVGITTTFSLGGLMERGAGGRELFRKVLTLVGYWVLMTHVPVPGLGSTALAPDLNLSNWLDLKLIGRNHLMHETMTWDPGVLAGHWLRSSHVMSAKVIGLLVAGAVGIALGTLWDRTYPIIKNLWTGSFVLFTAGMACLILAVVYWLVDGKGYRGWAARPFIVFGTNAITAYWLSSLMAIFFDWVVITSPQDGESLTLKTYIYETFYSRWLSPENASLAYALTYVLIWLGLLSLLYRKRIFIRI
jgi:predicted acyltransferase